MARYLANCKCGGRVIIRTNNAFRVPELLGKRGWRLIDPYKSSYDIKYNWRCPLCAAAYEDLKKGVDYGLIDGLTNIVCDIFSEQYHQVADGLDNPGIAKEVEV